MVSEDTGTEEANGKGAEDVDKERSWTTALPLNIPLEKNSSYIFEDQTAEEGDQSSLKNEENVLNHKFSKIKISDCTSESDSEDPYSSDDGENTAYISKGPGKSGIYKTSLKLQTTPYPIRQIYYTQNRDSGGWLNVHENLSPQIFKSPSNDLIDPDEVLKEFFESLSQSESNILDNAIDEAVNSGNSQYNSLISSVSKNIVSEYEEYDSDYFSLHDQSPFSQDSPINESKFSLSDNDSNFSPSPSGHFEPFPSNKVESPETICPNTFMCYPSLNIVSPCNDSSKVHIVSDTMRSKEKSSLYIQSLDNCNAGSRHNIMLRPDVDEPVQEHLYKDPALKRLQKILKKDIRIVEIENQRIAHIKDELFYAIDDDNETRLMKVLQEPSNSYGFLQKINAIVERVKRAKRLDYLLHKDSSGHDSLYIAAIKHPELSILARYIADSIIELGGNFTKVSYDESLLHILARCGDGHVSVVADLLNAKTIDNKPSFDLNQLNVEAQTPLHIAAKTHSFSSLCVKITKILMNHGASLALKDENGMTPLHLAIRESCDPILVKSMLQPFVVCNEAVNISDNQRYTALHFAASRNDLPLHQQKQVIKYLIDYGANRCQNSFGRYPISLVDPSRKEEIKATFNKRK